LPNKTQYHYSYIIIIFHAIAAFAFIGALVLGYCAIYFGAEHKPLLLMLHRSLGLLGIVMSFGMVLSRLFERPHPILGFTRFENFMRRAVRISLYVLPVLIFLTGYFALSYKLNHFAFFYVVDVPSHMHPNPMYKSIFSTLHYWLNVFFILAITLHVRAVLHHFLHRRRLLYRMFPFKIFMRKK
jgi:cytochrome b561